MRSARITIQKKRPRNNKGSRNHRPCIIEILSFSVCVYSHGRGNMLCSRQCPMVLLDTLCNVTATRVCLSTIRYVVSLIKTMRYIAIFHIRHCASSVAEQSKRRRGVGTRFIASHGGGAMLTHVPPTWTR